MEARARFALGCILAHFAVNAAHGAAHFELQIPLSLPQKVFICTVIAILPLLAALLIWREITFGGGLLLAASLAGALIFGVWNHYVAISPDHVSHLPATERTEWKVLFQATAILLVPVEGCGTWAAFRLLRRARS